MATPTTWSLIIRADQFGVGFLVQTKGEAK